MMRIETGVIEGDLEIDYALELQGGVSGNITVKENGLLKLLGMCGGDLILEKSTVVDLYGTVAGNVYNHNGYLSVYGVINGKLIEDDPNSIIHPDAVISNNEV